MPNTLHRARFQRVPGQNFLSEHEQLNRGSPQVRTSHTEGKQLGMGKLTEHAVRRRFPNVNCTRKYLHCIVGEDWTMHKDLPGSGDRTTAALGADRPNRRKEVQPGCRVGLATACFGGAGRARWRPGSAGAHPKGINADRTWPAQPKESGLAGGSAAGCGLGPARACFGARLVRPAQPGSAQVKFFSSSYFPV